MVRVISQSLKILSIGTVTLLVVVGAFAFFDYWSDRAQSDEIGRPVIIEITPEDDTGSVADKLTDANLVRYGWYFETRYRFSDAELQPGTYTLRNGMSVNEIIDTITIAGPDETGEGEQAQAPAAIEVTFIEGQRTEEYAQALVEAGWPGEAEDFIAAARDPGRFEGWDFLDGLPEGATLEGFLFPDSYRFGSDASADQIITLMLQQFDAQFGPDLREAAAAGQMSVFEVVTIASIVEREVAVAEERPTVAALYLNRLNADMPLQADPTLQYAVGTAQDWWPESSGQLIEDASGSLYNTYEIAALPPGPISNPGLASIQAVVQPADVEFIYMYAPQGSDEHLFANTIEEHENNICSNDPDAELCGGDGFRPVDGSERAVVPTIRDERRA